MSNLHFSRDRASLDERLAAVGDKAGPYVFTGADQIPEAIRQLRAGNDVLALATISTVIGWRAPEGTRITIDDGIDARLAAQARSRVVGTTSEIRTLLVQPGDGEPFIARGRPETLAGLVAAAEHIPDQFESTARAHKFIQAKLIGIDRIAIEEAGKTDFAGKLIITASSNEAMTLSADTGFPACTGHEDSAVPRRDLRRRLFEGETLIADGNQLHAVMLGGMPARIEVTEAAMADELIATQIGIACRKILHRADIFRRFGQDGGKVLQIDGPEPEA